jgi:hypothetical protein
LPPTGRLRANAFFSSDETTVFLMFFPGKTVSLANATLSWMYGAATGYSFSGGDRVELRFPVDTFGSGRAAGERSRSFELNLMSGAIVASRVVLKWK